MGQVVPFAPQARSRARSPSAGDWSREERARLEALRRRFAKAGVRVEVVYGATDDGDPWCVVMDEHEEVLIHVARIGAMFVVHHALDDALREGRDLRDVLADRLAHEGVADGAVVVPFSRAQNLLALIVAAAFFYETAGAEPPAPAIEPQGEDPAPHALAAAEAHALPAGAHAAGPSEASAAVQPVDPPPALPVWRAFAEEAEGHLGGHGWSELARVAAPAATPVIGLIGAAVPQVAAAAPQPMFEVPAPSQIARAIATQSPVSTGSTGGGGPGAASTFARHPQPDPPKPDPASGDPATGGPAKPDPEPAVDPGKPEPDAAPVHDHAGHDLDHDAILSVGHSLFHAALA